MAAPSPEPWEMAAGSPSTPLAKPRISRKSPPPLGSHPPRPHGPDSDPRTHTRPAKPPPQSARRYRPGFSRPSSTAQASHKPSPRRGRLCHRIFPPPRSPPAPHGAPQPCGANHFPATRRPSPEPHRREGSAQSCRRLSAPPQEPAPSISRPPSSENVAHPPPSPARNRMSRPSNGEILLPSRNTSITSYHVQTNRRFFATGHHHPRCNILLLPLLND